MTEGIFCNGLRYLRWGSDGETVRADNAKARIMIICGTLPQRQVHALLVGAQLGQVLTSEFPRLTIRDHKPDKHHKAQYLVAYHTRDRFETFFLRSTLTVSLTRKGRA